MASNITEAALKAKVEAAEDEIERLPQRLSKLIRPHSEAAADVVGAIIVDSPLTLLFAATCFLVHLVNVLGGGDGSFSRTFFAVTPWWGFSFVNPLSYWRLVSHVLGHGSWGHLHGNMVNTLLVGPSCERDYGAYNLLKIMLWTALASALAHMLFGSRNALQLGASGIVFMLILLNSLVEAKSGRIPLTFLCQVALWCTNEFIAQFGAADGVSHIAHLSGAVVGTVAGYQLHGERVQKQVTAAAKSWLGRIRQGKKRS
eukprot:g1232.t1